MRGKILSYLSSHFIFTILQIQLRNQASYVVLIFLIYNIKNFLYKINNIIGYLLGFYKFVSVFRVTVYKKSIIINFRNRLF